MTKDPLKATSVIEGLTRKEKMCITTCKRSDWDLFVLNLSG